MRVEWHTPAITALALLLWAPRHGAETYPLPRGALRRKLQITREYTIPAAKGQPTQAAIPALMSFWGSTNEQVIKSSQFTYEIKPDSIEITTDDLGMRRRNYLLTWNAPEADRIKVQQTLVAELQCRDTLYTAATLPYPDGVRQKHAPSLGRDDNKGINPDNPALEKICTSMKSKSRHAEEVVELVCDWINENVKFGRGGRPSSDETLRSKKAGCTGMSMLACAMLRRIGIPSEMVSGKFIGADGGHSYIEVYFPDAGWVFYDLSNHERGFKSPDCLATSGFSVRSVKGKKFSWLRGYFSKEEDLGKYNRRIKISGKLLRKGPRGTPVLGVKVVRRSPPSTVKVRYHSLSRLMTDLAISPGVRDYAPEKKATGEKPTPPPAKTAPAVEKPPAPRPVAKPQDPDAKRTELLNMAKSYMANNMFVKARSFLEQIIKEYPGSPQAEEAGKMLEKMKK